MAVGSISRLNSEDMPSGDRLAVLMDTYAAIERVDIDLIGEAPVTFDVAKLELPDVIVLEASVSPMAPRRTRRQATDGKDDIVVAFITDGVAYFDPDGKGEIEVRAGEAYLGFNDRASSHRLYGAPQFLDITIPRATLAPLVQDLDTAGRGLLAHSPELTLLRRFAEGLVRSDAVIDSGLARVCSAHLVDLVALAVGARAEPRELATQRGLAHARFASIRTDIEANLGHPALSVEFMARRHGISPQYLRALFYRSGRSFSDHVRDSRLDRAFGFLTDPGHASRTISDIAFSCGFGDLSTFNRAFRRRFGLTPSDARENPSDAGE